MLFFGPVKRTKRQPEQQPNGNQTTTSHGSHLVGSGTVRGQVARRRSCFIGQMAMATDAPPPIPHWRHEKRPQKRWLKSARTTAPTFYPSIPANGDDGSLFATSLATLIRPKSHSNGSQHAKSTACRPLFSFRQHLNAIF